MTTIAYKDGVLAADRAISGSGHVGTTRKVWKRKSDGALVGGCGEVATLQRWAEWFLAGERGTAPNLGTDDDSASQMLVVRPNGKVEDHGRYGKAMYEAPYHAIGSGSDYALGAMAFGATARQAVAAAMKHDHCTGSGVQYVKLA